MNIRAYLRSPEMAQGLAILNMMRPSRLTLHRRPKDKEYLDYLWFETVCPDCGVKAMRTRHNGTPVSSTGHYEPKCVVCHKTSLYKCKYHDSWVTRQDGLGTFFADKSDDIPL